MFSPNPCLTGRGLESADSFVHQQDRSTLPAVVAQAVSAVALILLTASGVSKIVEPDPTRGAMAAARLPSSRTISRGLGLVEILSGVVGLALGGRWLAPAVVLYLGFLAFTTIAVRQRLPIQSCGCFGREDTPPTTAHIVFNAVAAVSLTVTALMIASPVPWSGPPTELVLYLLFALLGAYLAYLVMAQLPGTLHPTSSQ